MLYQAVVIVGEGVDVRSFGAALEAEGVTPTFVSDASMLDPTLTCDVLLVHVSFAPADAVSSALHRAKDQGVAVMALVGLDRLGDFDTGMDVLDFILHPFRPGELAVRIKRGASQRRAALSKAAIRAGDLTIDPDRYEVSLAGSKVVLTYKEYQLLVLLATNPDRVFTRESLLSRVWGYDYFGGTRTVDVHVRRLRAKLENADHVFIETVWNVGYRFKPQA
jgi:DNA-binding response OmpR family regulator